MRQLNHDDGPVILRKPSLNRYSRYDSGCRLLRGEYLAMPHSTAPSPGLQALILCGPGVSLNTFTANPQDSPKALIPIANRPMIWYPIEWCYRLGVYSKSRSLSYLSFGAKPTK